MEEVISKIEKKGHFLLSSGMHSDSYYEKFRILEEPSLLSEVVDKVKDTLASFSPTVIVGPTFGGAILAYEIARTLGTKAYYAEKEKGKRTLRRGFTFKKEDRVIVVDDILTTGSSLKETIKAVEEKGGNVVASFVMVKRGEIEIEVPLIFIWKGKGSLWLASECPLCKKGIPLEKPGSPNQ